MIIESFKRAKRRFMSDIWRRLGALALAIYVWTWINVRVTDSQIVSGIPIHISYDQNKMQLMNSPDQIRDFVVQSRGKDMDANWMLASSYELQVNMPASVKGTVTLEFGKDQLEVVKKPNGVTLKEMQPSKIRVTADEIVETWIGIAHVPSKMKPNGDLVRFLAPQPARVKVRGPSRIVHNLQTLTLKEPDLSMPFGSTIRLQVDNPDRSSLTITPQEVSVNVEKQIMEEQDIEKLTPHLLLPPNTDLALGTVSLPNVTVRLHGSVNDMAELKSANTPIRVFLDLTDVTDVGPWSRKVMVGGLPNGVEVVKIDPDVIHDIVLTRRETTTTKPAAADAEPVAEDGKGVLEGVTPKAAPTVVAPHDGVKTGTQEDAPKQAVPVEQPPANDGK
jgi:YbbR domain-containing protein